MVVISCITKPDCLIMQSGFVVLNNEKLDMKKLKIYEYDTSLSFISISIEPVTKNYQGSGLYNTTMHEFEKYVYIDGLKFTLSDFFSTIGNHELVKWNEIEPIKKSTSDNRKKEFISKYANEFLKIKQVI